MTLLSTSESPWQTLFQNLAEIAAQVGRSVVAIKGRRFSCSGLVTELVTLAESLANVTVQIRSDRLLGSAVIKRSPFV